LGKVRSLFGKVLETVPSPYLADINEELKTYERAKGKGKSEKKPESQQVSLFDVP